MAMSNLKTKRAPVGNTVPDELLEDDTTSNLRALRPPEEVLESVIDGLAEMALDASDEDVLAEAREESGDPAIQAEEVRNVLLRAANKPKLDTERRRHNARQAGSGGS